MEITDMTVKIIGGFCIIYGIFAFWRFAKLVSRDQNNSISDENDDTGKHSLFNKILTLVLAGWIISSFITKVAMVIGIGILFCGATSIWIYHLFGACMLVLLYKMAFGKDVSKDEWGTPIKKIKKPAKNEMLTLVIVLSWIFLWSIVDMIICLQAHPVSLLFQYFS